MFYTSRMKNLLTDIWISTQSKMANTVVNFLTIKDLNILDCRSQSYHNAKSMSGSIDGLQTKTLEINKLEIFFPFTQLGWQKCHYQMKSLHDFPFIQHFGGVNWKMPFLVETSKFSNELRSLDGQLSMIQLQQWAHHMWKMPLS